MVYANKAAIPGWVDYLISVQYKNQTNANSCPVRHSKVKHQEEGSMRIKF